MAIHIGMYKTRENPVTHPTMLVLNDSTEIKDMVQVELDNH